ncbi:MAG: flavocytochrome c [Clostridia bacterium]|nr:flavocytochrome c [Clostridia bacterium]
MKKILAVLLATAMLMASCVSAFADATPGTYIGTGNGRNGVLKVEVIFDNGVATEAKVVETTETQGISDAPIAQLPVKFVETQSLNLDTIAGATLTSNAVLEALADAAMQAGCDVEAMKNSEVKTDEAAAKETVLDADVVVVGAGGAGLSAALAAEEQGAKVIVIEKTVAVGGNTLRAGGWFNSADPERQKNVEMGPAQRNTVEAMLAKEPHDEKMAELQKTVKAQWDAYNAEGATYLFDSTEFHALQTYDGGDYIGNIDLIVEFTEQAPVTLTWLESIGLDTNPQMNMCVGALWQRSHSVIGNTNVGYGFIHTLDEAVRAKENISVLFETAANELIVTDGRVTGVKAVTTNGDTCTVNATKGVVLATGGFGGDLEKVQQIRPDIPASIRTTSISACTGDGIWMAQAIGADTVDLDQIQLYPLASAIDGSTAYGMVGPSTSMFVNPKGERYVNENERRDVLAAAAFAQGGVVYCISDSVAANNTRDINVVEYAVEKGHSYKADTIEELAVQLGMDPAVLKATVEKFNAACDAENDPEFGRTIFGANLKVETAPFYASPRSPSVHHTMGGLKIDGATHVIDVNGNIIPGLYAAGETTGGLHGGNRLGGNAIADCMTFGRIAGQTIMAD